MIASADRILGACNPAMAHQAIGIERGWARCCPATSSFVRSRGGVEVSAVDPAASKQAIDNPASRAVAGQVRDLLDKGNRRWDLERQASNGARAPVDYTIVMDTDETDACLDLLLRNLQKYGTIMNTLAGATELIGTIRRKAG